MSDGAGSDVEVSSEAGSDADYGEAASQAEEGAAEQAAQAASALALPEWAADLLPTPFIPSKRSSRRPKPSSTCWRS